MKRRSAICLVMAVLLLCSAMLCGCVKNTENSTTASYCVKVVDYAGNPYTSGVVVMFKQNGQQVALQTPDESGTAVKELEKGDYTVELMFTDSEAQYYYDTENLSLSADNTNLTLVLAQAQSADSTTLYATSLVSGEYTEYPAYYLKEGTTYLSISDEDRNYYLFCPTVAGTYTFSASGADVEIGYYGYVYFVQSNSIAEVADDTFTVSISASMIGAGEIGTTELVIGVDAADGVENCFLTVTRIGDPEHTLADEDWTVYETTAELSPYTLPAGTVLKDFDLTASTDAYTLVRSEEDGFYHLNSADGPLVLARLGEPSAYLDSIKDILDNSGFIKYFFDDDGNFLRKETYTDCLLEYLQCIDEETGVYPLTDDLIYIIQQRGDYVGWWDPAGSNYIFTDANGTPVLDINPDIAWLFICCYAE